MLAGKKTKVGIAVPQMFPYGPVDMGFVEEHLRLVESLGYDSVWTQDSVLGTMDTLDPFTLLAYASTVTERVGLGISVLVLPFQNPVHLAKISASLGPIVQWAADVGSRDRWARGQIPVLRVRRQTSRHPVRAHRRVA